MNIKLVIPDEKVDAYINAFAVRYGYKAGIETKKEFMLNKILDFPNGVYIAVEANKAEDSRISLVSAAEKFVKDTTIKEDVEVL